MIRFVILAIVVAVAWEGYSKYKRSHPTAGREAVEVTTTVRPRVREQPQHLTTGFACDGRTHCSQMTSCEEATYFLRNCPGTQMDGDHDGIPCEKQWCR